MEEPNDTERDDRADADELSVDSNDVGKSAKLLLERRLGFLDLEGVLVAFKLLSDVTLLKRVLADCKDDSLAATAHNNRILEEDRVWVVYLVVMCIQVADLLGSHLLRSLQLILHLVLILLKWIEELELVDLHVHFLKQQAVSWDTVSLAKHDNITNDDILVQDCLGGAHGAAEHIAGICLDLILEPQELLLFAPITERLDQTCEQHGEPDRDSIEQVDGIGKHP